MGCEKWGIGSYSLNGYRVSIWDDEKFWRWIVVMYSSVNILNATELYT